MVDSKGCLSRLTTRRGGSSVQTAWSYKECTSARGPAPDSATPPASTSMQQQHLIQLFCRAVHPCPRAPMVWHGLACDQMQPQLLDPRRSPSIVLSTFCQTWGRGGCGGPRCAGRPAPDQHRMLATPLEPDRSSLLGVFSRYAFMQAVHSIHPTPHPENSAVKHMYLRRGKEARRQRSSRLNCTEPTAFPWLLRLIEEPARSLLNHPCDIFSTVVVANRLRCQSILKDTVSVGALTRASRRH